MLPSNDFFNHKGIMTCPKCQLSNATCICSQLESVSFQPSILIIRHYKESFRKSNSARILKLSADNVEIIDYGKKDEPALTEFDTTGAALLFPAENTANIYTATSPPTKIIVLDGSWRHARRMYRRLTFLHRLPHLSINKTDQPLPRIREPNFPGGMSTMEACIQALEGFNEPAVLSTLKKNYSLWLNQVRVNTGIRRELLPGESFKQARLEQDIIDGKIISPR